MRLYLIQHGKAMPKGRDPERSLSEEGRTEVQKVADFITARHVTVSHLWHSGKTRARQTAEIYAQTVTVGHGPTARNGLAPNDNVALLRDELAVATEDAMIVGHMPFVSKLASLLLTGYESPSVVTFKNAGVVCLGRTQDNRWQVEWIVTPELLA